MRILTLNLTTMAIIRFLFLVALGFVLTVVGSIMYLESTASGIGLLGMSSEWIYRGLWISMVGFLIGYKAFPATSISVADMVTRPAWRIFWKAIDWGLCGWLLCWVGVYIIDVVFNY